MTNADPADIVTAARDGVTVEKSFEPDDFPVPAIAFRIDSERTTTVSIRLVDTVPDDVAPENIGFHPKYGAEFWDVEDGRIVFQRDLAPGEEYTTVYGLRGGNADTASKFMSEPTLESVEPPLSDDDTIDAALDAAEIDDVLSSGSGTDELGDPVETEGTEASANGDLDEPDVLEIGEDGDGGDDTDPLGDERSPTEGEREVSGGDIDPSEQTDEALESDDEGEGPVAPAVGKEDQTPAHSETVTSTTSPEEGTGGDGHDSLVSELATELQDGNADEEDLMTLRDALGLDLASASVEARIEHLQSEVSDLEAYTDAFESFLDEEGDAQTLIAEARDGYEGTMDRLDEVEAELAEISSELDERLGTIDETIEEQVESELEAIRSDAETLDRRLETEADARREIESDLEELSAELAEVAEMRDRLANALGGFAGRSSSSDSEDDEGDETESPLDDETDESEADPDDETGDAEVTDRDDEADEPDSAAGDIEDDGN